MDNFSDISLYTIIKPAGNQIFLRVYIHIIFRIYPEEFDYLAGNRTAPQNEDYAGQR